MEGRKICRLLIVIFAALSILFFALYKKESSNISYLTEDFVLGAVENLKSSGVTVDPEIIDRKIPEKDIYSFELASIDDYHSKITKALVNEIYGGNVTTLNFDMPDGVSVGLYDNTGSDRELGRIVMSNSDLSFNFSKAGFTAGSADAAFFNGQMYGVTKEYTSKVDSLVKSLSYDSNSTYRIVGSSYDEQYLIISVIQVIDGYDLIDVYLNIVFDGGEIADISGTWITEKTTAKYHNKLVDGVNVLYELDFSKIKAVTDERLVYFLRKSDDGRYFVVPGWEITYTEKNGSVNKAYFDAL